MKEHAILKTWMRDVQKSQNAVDSILLLPTTPLRFSRCSQRFIVSKPKPLYYRVYIILN